MLDHPSTRRGFLGAGAGAAATLTFAGMLPRIASAAGAHDPRLIVMILRGAMDGIGAVMPVGDPHFAGLGDRFRPDEDGVPTPLDGFFSMHGALPNMASLYGAGQLVIVHAICTQNSARSHFESQDLLESGLPSVENKQIDSGWLNRMLTVHPTNATKTRSALAVGATPPLIMRGKAPVETWQPQVFKLSDDDTIARLAALYGERDKVMRQALLDGTDLDKVSMGNGGPGKAAAPMRALAQATTNCANMMRADDGPRVACISCFGWDTHAAEPPRLARGLSSLDAAVAALKAGLGPLWTQTAVVMVTEFGRTARVNASRGTDHGTGTAAFIAGGALRRSQIVTDWPGLGPDKLFEGRDLAATRDIRSLFKGLLAEHMDIGRQQLDTEIFPDSGSVEPLASLFA
jgi:uncharacterized protein (DUF1501 family)